MVKRGQNLEENIVNDPKSHKILLMRKIFIVIHSNVLALSRLYLSIATVQTINCLGPLITAIVDYMQNRV